MKSDVKQQTCGIYKIENLINGKVYIGQSVNIKKRWDSHRFNARHGETSHLYCAMRKYGIENFSFEVIEECSQEDLNQLEIEWISFYDSTNREKGYNILRGGDSGGTIYDYEAIYKEWLKGKKCQDLEKEFNCDDFTITSALRTYGVSEIEARQHSVQYKKYVALSWDKKPLKVFSGIPEIQKYFNCTYKNAASICSAISGGFRQFGYYWDYYSEDMTIPELTDREFLLERRYNYQKKPYSEEQRIKDSLNQRTVKRPSREELKELIRTKTFVEIGKMYGVSDNAIRKWCDFEKLPRKKSDIKSYSDEEWSKI